jgi:hypothetical protein
MRKRSLVFDMSKRCYSTTETESITCVESLSITPRIGIFSGDFELEVSSSVFRVSSSMFVLRSNVSVVLLFLKGPVKYLLIGKGFRKILTFPLQSFECLCSRSS